MNSLARKVGEFNKDPDWVIDLRIEAEEFIDKASYPPFLPRLELEKFNPLKQEVPIEIPEIKSLDDLPEDIRNLLKKMGVPEHEWAKVLGLLQVDETSTTSSFLDYFDKLGLEVLPMSEALRRYEWLKEYAFKLMPYRENKYVAYHTAYWSGGAFIRVKKGVKVKIPVHAYFLITESALAQADHAFVLAEEGSEVTFIEGCTAPPLARFSAHLGATEIYVEKGAKVRGVVLQNWPHYVHTRPFTHGVVEEGAELHLVAAVLGNGASAGRYELIDVVGKGGKAIVESISFTKKKEVLGDYIHINLKAPDSSGLIVTKAVTRDQGENTSATVIRADKNARGSRGHIECAGLLLTPGGKHETYPVLSSETGNVHLDHEAYVGRISEEALEYMRSRGFSEETAITMLIKGYIQPILKHIPFEYVMEIMRIAEMVASGEA